VSAFRFRSPPRREPVAASDVLHTLLAFARSLPALIRVAIALVLLISQSARAEDAKPLRWGGDKNGGAPFIFEDETGTLTGFEVELADYFAKQLGRKAVFVQNQWDNLPELLKRPNTGGENDIDIVMNGYEFSKEFHNHTTTTTAPYYIYTFRLIGRTDDDSVLSWHGLGTATPRKRVGVLRGTASQRYIEARYSEGIEVVPSETVTEMLQLVSDGRVDATVQDSPAADYYVAEGRFPKLRVVDEPVAPGYYVLLLRATDTALQAQLNSAIRKAIRDGTLRDLYKKYGLWNGHQQRLIYLAEQPWPDVVDELTIEEQKARPPLTMSLGVLLPNLVKAAGMTVLLAVVSFPLAIVLGVIVALGRVYGPLAVRVPCVVYVEVLRGTPLLLQLFVIFYLLPQLGSACDSSWLSGMLSLSPFAAAVIGLALNYSACEAENYRAGLQAVPVGQLEAALALGLSWRTAIRRVVLPQAVRIVIPSVTNDFIALFKDTAVCSSILIVELTGLYYQYKSYPDVVLHLALSVAVLYLAMSVPLSYLANRLERRLTAVPGGGR
jgi:polar amino acid transport system substrate-binding protein